MRTSKYPQIGERIAQARRAAKLRQEDLAAMLARPRTHAAISDIERGKTLLNVDELIEIAGLLDTSLRALLFGERGTDFESGVREGRRLAWQQMGEIATRLAAMEAAVQSPLTGEAGEGGAWWAGRRG